jgi:hypothetical protein
MEYEIELCLAGRSVFLTAKITELVATTESVFNGVVWSEAHVVLMHASAVLWDTTLKPEDLDFGRDSDVQLFDACQEIAEAQATS